MALKRLPNVLLAMSPMHCFAEVDGDISDRINMEGLCLTAGSSENLYNGAPVSFTECSDDGAFWMHFDGHVDASQLFAIHVGTYRIGPTIGPFPPDPFSVWCLDSVDVDSNSSLVTIWECNDSHNKISSCPVPTTPQELPTREPFRFPTASAWMVQMPQQATPPLRRFAMVVASKFGEVAGLRVPHLVAVVITSLIIATLSQLLLHLHLHQHHST